MEMWNVAALHPRHSSSLWLSGLGFRCRCSCCFCFWLLQNVDMTIAGKATLAELMKRQQTDKPLDILRTLACNARRLGRRPNNGPWAVAAASVPPLPLPSIVCLVKWVFGHECVLCLYIMFCWIYVYQTLYINMYADSSSGHRSARQDHIKARKASWIASSIC